MVLYFVVSQFCRPLAILILSFGPTTSYETTDLVLSQEQDQNDNETSDAVSLQEQHCVSKFDFTRIEGVRAFTVNYMVQGRSWYTKWLTVLEQFPIYTRFKTFDYTDLGGSLNIRVTMGKKQSLEKKDYKPPPSRVFFLLL